MSETEQPTDNWRMLTMPAMATLERECEYCEYCGCECEKYQEPCTALRIVKNRIDRKLPPLTREMLQRIANAY